MFSANQPANSWALADTSVVLLAPTRRAAALNGPDSIVRTKATSPVVFSRMVVMVLPSETQSPRPFAPVAEQQGPLQLPGALPNLTSLSLIHI